MSREIRRATIRTDHDDPETIARALAPDDTDEMETVVDGRTVRTRIERETTGGLHSTVDDYVVNLDVAVRVVERARADDDPEDDATPPANDTKPTSDTDTDTQTETESQ